MPIIDREVYVDGLTIAEMMEDTSLDPRAGYPLQLGQPENVRRAFMEAMGLDPDNVEASGAAYLTAAGAATSRRVWT